MHQLCVTPLGMSPCAGCTPLYHPSGTNEAATLFQLDLSSRLKGLSA